MRAARLIVPAILALALVSGEAMACSCGRNPTAEGILESASAVFTGVVQNTVSVAPGVGVTRFKVTESFKGTSPDAVVEVRHPNGSSASCGVTFTPGETSTLAVYRNEARKVLTANLCSAWMFLPHVGLSKSLIERMRELRR